MISYIEEFIKKNQLNKEYCDQHIGTFMHVENSRIQCENCPGIFACTQKSKGQRLALRFDDTLIETIENCSYKIESEKTVSLKSRYIYSNIPEQYYSLTLENIDLPDNEIKKYCAKVLEVYEERSKKGLYVYGNMGVGKTYMLIALANSLVKKGKKVAFVKITDFINEMRKAVTLSDGEYDEIMTKLKKCDVLILDDIGSESVSTFSRDDVLFNILDYRMENNLCTFFTGNYDLKGLLDHYIYTKAGKSETLQAERLLERIEILSEPFVLKGENRRRLK